MAPRRRSKWESGFPPPSAPLPVEGGLRARSRRGAIGESWWSRRFLDLLESLGIGGRLDRGRTYARKGQVLTLDLEEGEVVARVQGSRERPYKVGIALEPLPEADWRLAEEAMAARAAFLAALLAGEMPDDIEEAFAGCSRGLFPASRDELRAECSCPDWASPCKHVAAVYYLLAEAFDDDPFLILAWRGRPRDRLLADLRALRGTSPAPGGEAGAHGTGEAYDPWAPLEQVGVPDLTGRLESFWQAGEALGNVRLEPVAPHPPDAAARGLAPLGREIDGHAVTDLLRPAYVAITSGARERLLARRPTRD